MGLGGDLWLHPKHKYFVSSTLKILFPSYSCKHIILLSISCFTFTLSFIVFQNHFAALNMPLVILCCEAGQITHRYHLFYLQQWKSQKAKTTGFRFVIRLN